MRSWHQSCLTRVKKRLGERKGLERGRRKRWRRGRKDWTSREPEAWHQHVPTRVKKRPWGEEEAGEGKEGHEGLDKQRAP